MSRPAPYVAATCKPPVVFAHSQPRLIGSESDKKLPSLPRPKRVRGEPELPPLIKLRNNDFGSLGEESPQESFGVRADAIAAMRSAMPGLLDVPAAFAHQPRERLRRSAKDFEPGQAVTDAAQLAAANADVVSCVMLKGQPLERLPKLWASVARLVSLRVLVVAGCGLTKVEPIELPLLRLLDMSENSVSKESNVLALCKGCPILQEIDVRGNPFKDAAGLSEKLMGLMASLETLNGASVDLDVRVRCVEAHHKRGRAQAQLVRWEWTLCSLSGVADLTRWEPATIRKLLLPKCGLTVFHARPFVSLQVLDLSGNLISTVMESGVAYCEALRVCDLRNNAIAKREQLVAFQFNLELQQLFLSGNEVAKVKDYRSFVIASTRACRGSNRAPGLQELDGVPVTLEERCAAFEQHPVKGGDDADLLRWQVTVFDYFGRVQLAQAPEQARYCVLPDKRLSVAALESLVNLRVLDLSRNNLTTVTGLEQLQQLVFVDLSNNAKLSLTHVLPQLTCRTLLQCMFFEDNNRSHARGDRTKPAYRNQVLNALLLANPHLNYVDELLITASERVETLARSGAAADDCEVYRFRLACALQAWKLPRVLHPSFLEPEKRPYRCDTVTSLYLADSGLTVANFSAFVALRELSVRNNRLTEMTELGLRGLSSLRRLDCANNAIRTALPAVAALLDGLPALKLVALQGNPCLRSPEDRARLISLLRCMAQDAPTLRVLDVEVTVRERVAVLVESGALSVEEGDDLRYRAILMQCIPLHEPAEQITRLDFSHTGLRAAGLVKYVNLRVLLLRGNDVKTLASLHGLDTMRYLEVLDLRDNQLGQLAELVRLLESQLGALQALGLSGNRLRKDYRPQLLAELRHLHMRKSALSTIDDEEVTPAELFAAAQAAGITKTLKDLQQFRFDVAFIRRSPDVPSRAHITELDLSSAGLEFVNLDPFYNLRKLSLANNSLNGKTLSASQVGTLTLLTHLNLANNKIKNLDTMVQVLLPLAALVDLTFSGNSCCGSLSRVEMGRRIERLSDPQCALQFLNDAELTVEERCEIAALQGRKDLDVFRLQFCVYQRRITEDVQSLSLARCGLRTLGGLQIFTTLTALDLADNGMTVFERNVFAYLVSLRYLDLRNNDLVCTLRELTDALAACRLLETLHVLHALRDGSTARRNQYLLTVFAALPSCRKLDGHERRLAAAATPVAPLASPLQYRPSDAKRMSQTGVAPLRPKASDPVSAAAAEKQRKRKSIRKVRSGATGGEVRKAASAVTSPMVPRIVQLETGVALSNSSESDDSPHDEGAPAISPKHRSGSEFPSLAASAPSLRGLRSKSPGREEAAAGGTRKSPGREGGESRKKGHSRTKSGGRRGGGADLIGGGGPASPGPASPSSAGAGGSSRHRRGGSTVHERGLAVPAETISSPKVSAKAVLGASSTPDAVRKRSGSTHVRKKSEGSVRKTGSRSLRSGSGGSAAGSDDALQLDLSGSFVKAQEREQAIRDLEALEMGRSQPADAAEEATVDDDVVNSAAQFLRSLDFGSPAPSSDSGPSGRGGSDDEYAESDEAEWKDLSGDDDEEGEAVAEPPNAARVDPRLVMAELEMFRIGEGPEIEEEAAPEDGGGGGGGGLRDKFDLGTARGSTTARNNRSSLRGSTGSGEVPQQAPLTPTTSARGTSLRGNKK